LRPLLSTLFPYTTLFRSSLENGSGRSRIRRFAVGRQASTAALVGGCQHRLSGFTNEGTPAPARRNVRLESGGENGRSDGGIGPGDRKSTRLNSSHVSISY